jgi:hypothetical protein
MNTVIWFVRVFLKCAQIAGEIEVTKIVFDDEKKVS